MKKIVVLLVTFLMAVALVSGIRAVTTSSHYWSRRSIKVLRDGKTSPDAVAFQSKDGSFLIYISSKDDWYSFRPRYSRMGLCGIGRYIPLYFGMLLQDESFPCVGFNDVKAHDPHLDIRSNEHFLFTSMVNERIEVWLEESE